MQDHADIIYLKTWLIKLELISLLCLFPQLIFFSKIWQKLNMLNFVFFYWLMNKNKSKDTRAIQIFLGREDFLALSVNFFLRLATIFGGARFQKKINAPECLPWCYFFRLSQWPYDSNSGFRLWLNFQTRSYCFFEYYDPPRFSNFWYWCAYFQNFPPLDRPNSPPHSTLNLLPSNR